MDCSNFLDFCKGFIVTTISHRKNGNSVSGIFSNDIVNFCRNRSEVEDFFRNMKTDFSSSEVSPGKKPLFQYQSREDKFIISEI